MSVTIAIAQINPTVGDLEGNRQLVTQFATTAHRQGCQVILFPQLALTGYPLADLALRPSFQRAAEEHLITLAEQLDQAGVSDAHVVVGALGVNLDGQPATAATVLHQGQVTHRCTGQLLPQTGAPSCPDPQTTDQGTVTFQVAGAKFGLTVEGSARQNGMATIGSDLDALLVLGGSAFEPGMLRHRTEAAQAQAQRVGAPLVYANLVGGQDCLVFDGGSLVISPTGALLCQADQFRQDLVLWNLADHSAKPPLTFDDEASTYQAITLGLADYVRKNGFSKVVLGLSGGIDSTLVAVMAADALGAEHVTGVAMPSRFSTPHSLADAADLAGRLGLDWRTVPIQEMVDPFLATLGLSGVAAENIQARVRGMILMAVSNMEGHLVLATGNKSELATGYSTIYGDAVGGFAPIRDLVKTQVWQLARWRNAQATARGEIKPIPENSITKPPSAELRPDQRDSDSLPEYHLLDPVLDRFIQGSLGRAQLLAEGLDPGAVDLALRLSDRAEWKRRQYPPGPKVSAWALDCNRRIPMTSHWQEELA